MYDERDTRTTTARTRIQVLYEEHSIVPSRTRFGCSSLSTCSQGLRRGLYTGNWAFVGCGYGKARIATHRAKVLFVAMDRGGHGGADCEEFEDTQKSFRSSIELPENPHMGGVSLILQHLLDEIDLRKISGQCALTNAIKCAQRTHVAKTHATRRMIAECAEHLRAEFKVLKPDLIITQGQHPTKTVLSCFSSAKSVGEYVGDGGRRTGVLVDSKGLIILTMPHPARQAGLKWKQGQIPSFWEEAIKKTRREFAKLREAV